MSDNLAIVHGSAVVRRRESASAWRATRSLDDTLSVITSAACDSIDWVDYASVTVARGAGMMASHGATDPLVLKVDALQSELGEGPSIEAVLGTAVSHAYDVGSDERWPAYGRRAIELGIKGQTGIRLHDDGQVVGALNLYSTKARVPEESASALAHMFAAQATMAICLASRVETLTEAIANRQDISQAIGIVMERFQLDESRAFAYFVRESQTSQVKLRVVAREFVERANASAAGR